MSALKEKQHTRMQGPLWKYTTMRDHDCWIILGLCMRIVPLVAVTFFCAQRQAAQSINSIYSHA